MLPHTSHLLCPAVELLQNEVTEKLPSESENLQLAFSRLQQALGKAYQYVDDVVVSRMGDCSLPVHQVFTVQSRRDVNMVKMWPTTSVGGVQNGKRKGDLAVGRYLADTCAAVPYVRKEDLEQLVQDNTQDALLVMYLANLVRAHVALADKLGTAALPLL